MKIQIDQDEYPAVPIGQWTYEEADQVLRVTGLTVGAVPLAQAQGNAAAGLAFAVVGWLRLHPGDDPIVLRQMQIDEIIVDFRDNHDDDESGEADAGPPAGAGAEAGDPATAAGSSKSARKSSTSATRPTRGSAGNRQ